MQNSMVVEGGEGGLGDGHLGENEGTGKKMRKRGKEDCIQNGEKCLKLRLFGYVFNLTFLFLGDIVVNGDSARHGSSPSSGGTPSPRSGRTGSS